MNGRHSVRVSLLALGCLLAMATQNARAEEFAVGVEVRDTKVPRPHRHDPPDGAPVVRWRR